MNLAEDITLSSEQVHWLTKEQALHYRILPKAKTTDQFELYYDDAAEPYELTAELEILTGLNIRLESLPATQISRLLSKYYMKDNAVQATTTQLQGQHHTDDFLLNLIGEAKNLKSSDIHIESYENKCRVRIRIDGMMVERVPA